jgi:hypothetical protein
MLDTTVSNIEDFLWRNTCVSSTQVNRCIWSKETYHHLETPQLRKISCQKLTQFSQGTMCYMLLLLTQMVNFWEIHVSSLLLNRPIWNKLNHFPPWNYDLQEVFLSKTNSALTGNNVLDVAASNIDDFPSRGTCVFSTQLNWPIWSKQSLSPPWTTKVAGSITLKNKLISLKETTCKMILILTQIYFFREIHCFYILAE